MDNPFYPRRPEGPPRLAERPDVLRWDAQRSAAEVNDRHRAVRRGAFMAYLADLAAWTDGRLLALATEVVPVPRGFRREGAVVLRYESTQSARVDLTDVEAP